jgi:hypothetical protein
MDNKEGGQPTTLKTHVLLLDPIRVKRDRPDAPPMVVVPTLNVRELPRTVAIYCWSSTRTAFKVKAESAVTRARAGSDPFEVGTPQALGPAECALLEEEIKNNEGGRVLAGYRIPVKLKEDFDLGPFHRGVRLSGDDGEEIQVGVTGVVVGDVTVGGVDAGVIQFGAFDRTRGSREETVTLESDVPREELKKVELDRARTPGFLDVRLHDPDAKPAEGHRTWRMEVKVLPNRARGLFPRGDDPDYRDCAVYLRTVGRTPRSIRVPVTGTANDPR